jgi:hypothetical protein
MALNIRNRNPPMVVDFVELVLVGMSDNIVDH